MERVNLKGRVVRSPPLASRHLSCYTNSLFIPIIISSYVYLSSRHHRQSPPMNYSRADFGLSDEWFLYFCPQSVFKIHPLFDSVFAEILEKNPAGHLVITGN